MANKRALCRSTKLTVFIHHLCWGTSPSESPALLNVVPQSLLDLFTDPLQGPEKTIYRVFCVIKIQNTRPNLYYIEKHAIKKTLHEN